jgi:MFS family permease
MPETSPKPLFTATFLGLLLAQFTATFNDQALHIVAIFFAGDVLVRLCETPGFDEKSVVALVTACFILPFLLFSPLAGVLSDRFSKRTILVFWKGVETGIMGLALVALALPRWFDPVHPGDGILPVVSAGLVILTVFLMGLHSTFFVPAKYGVMPEILPPSRLSLGNGLLEGTSFMAQIFGTAAGGLLYAVFKSKIVGPGQFEPGHEWFIGLLLLILALVGNGAAFLMQTLPAAAPNLPIDWSWWRPLRANLRLLNNSRPLTLAITGIAFAAFMTLFVRQTLLYDAEIKKEIAAVEQVDFTPGAALPVGHLATGQRVETGRVETKPGDAKPVDRVLPAEPGLGDRALAALDEAEMRVSLLLALIGFGVGLGSLCAGVLSGDRVELGLVPIGGLLLVVLFGLLAVTRGSELAVTVILFLIGLSAGLYIVPLFTLMQHRAPKEQKGNVIAASNFVNVVGGISSVLLFYALTFLLEHFFGVRLSLAAIQADPTLRSEYLRQLHGSFAIPQWLFALTSLVVVVTAVRLTLLQPDFDIRLGEFFRGLVSCRPRVSGLEQIPATGSALLLTDCRTYAEACRLMSAVDRTMRVIGLPAGADDSRLRGLLTLSRGRIATCEPGAGLESQRPVAQAALDEGELLAVVLPDLPQELSTQDRSVGVNLLRQLGWDESTLVLQAAFVRSDEAGGAREQPKVRQIDRCPAIRIEYVSGE